MDQAVGGRTVEVAAIRLGMAGADREADGAVVRAIMHRIGSKVPTLVGTRPDCRRRTRSRRRAATLCRRLAGHDVARLHHAALPGGDRGRRPRRRDVAAGLPGQGRELHARADRGSGVRPGRHPAPSFRRQARDRRLRCGARAGRRRCLRAADPRGHGHATGPVDPGGGAVLASPGRVGRRLSDPRGRRFQGRPRVPARRLRHQDVPLGHGADAPGDRLEGRPTHWPAPPTS